MPIPQIMDLDGYKVFHPYIFTDEYFVICYVFLRYFVFNGKAYSFHLIFPIISTHFILSVFEMKFIIVYIK